MNKKKRALVLAGGLPQIELIKKLKERQIDTVLCDGNENAIARPYADVFYKIPIFDIECVKNIAVKENVDFIITVCADQVLLVVAEVSEMLGLPCYIDFNTAVNVSDKKYMKRIFIDNNIPTSKYLEMEELDWQCIDELNFPLVVKPVDAYSSKGVRKVWNNAELEKYFNEARQISRSGNVIVEGFCSGEELSVDVYVENGEAKILCISCSEKLITDNQFIIFRGRYPATVTEEIAQQIQVVAQQIADAFELKDSPMLIQLINDGKKVFVLEFCARTGGNMKYSLIKSVSGVDVIDLVIDLSLGKKPHVEIKSPEKDYIINDFIYCKKGIFDRLEGFEELKQSGILADYKCLRPKGMIINGINSSSDRIAGICIKADSKDEYNEKLEKAVKNIKVLDIEGNDIMRHDLLLGLK